MKCKVIVIEGIDGSGKNTQANKLTSFLKEAGHYAECLSFPQYQESFAGKLIGYMLDGKLGDLSQIPALFISLLYALDRFETKDTIANLLEELDYLVLDRYVMSNVIYQLSKISKDELPESLKDIIEHIEYEVLGAIKPDLTIHLDVPVAVSADLIAKKRKRTYTDNQEDVNEANKEFLNACRDNYLQYSAAAPDCVTINCIDETTGELHSEDKVFSLIKGKIAHILK